MADNKKGKRGNPTGELEGRSDVISESSDKRSDATSRSKTKVTTDGGDIEQSDTASGSSAKSSVTSKRSKRKSKTNLPVLKEEGGEILQQSDTASGSSTKKSSTSKTQAKSKTELSSSKFTESEAESESSAKSSLASDRGTARSHPPDLPSNVGHSEAASESSPQKSVIGRKSKSKAHSPNPNMDAGHVEESDAPSEHSSSAKGSVASSKRKARAQPPDELPSDQSDAASERSAKESVASSKRTGKDLPPSEMRNEGDHASENSAKDSLASSRGQGYPPELTTDEDILSNVESDEHFPPPILKTDDKPPRKSIQGNPVASKVVYFIPPRKLPEPVPEPEEPPPVEVTGVPFILFAENKIQETKEEEKIDRNLNDLIEAIKRGKLYQERLDPYRKERPEKFRFGGMVKRLHSYGIPCPLNDDFSKLQGTNREWDPKGTAIEYFSPMLRAIVPVNMRGRYRGCAKTDDCMLGVDISKIPPKGDALEGFVERGRHENIQKLYDTMSAVGIDEPHLDYLVEIQALQAETLPIPMFYDMLNFGMEVANENLKILVKEDGYPPTDPVYISAHEHAHELRRKLRLYSSLGLEKLAGSEPRQGQYLPMWSRTRDEIIHEVLARKNETLREIGRETKGRQNEDKKLGKLIKDTLSSTKKLSAVPKRESVSAPGPGRSKLAHTKGKGPVKPKPKH